jgi:hypothetical protein
MNGRMAKKKGPRPIMERQIVEVRVGWEHSACDWCREPFRSKRVDARFCTAVCKAMSHYAKGKKRAQTA